MRNVLDSLEQTIVPGVLLEQQLDSILDNIGNIYSYLVFVDRAACRYIVKYTISQEDCYNTIVPLVAREELLAAIRQDNGSEPSVLTYRQPPLELMLTLYEPLIHTLANDMRNSWPSLELDDLLQTARLCMVKLYNRGYYIHKNLLRRAFVNETLMGLRKERLRPRIVSLDEVVSDNGDDTLITLGDTIVDTSLEDYLQEQEERELMDAKAKMLQHYISETLSPRQYEQILRAYSTKTVDQWSAKQIHNIKKKLKKEGKL